MSTHADLVQRLRELSGGVWLKPGGDARLLHPDHELLREAADVLATVSPQPCQQCAEKSREIAGFARLTLEWRDTAEVNRLAYLKAEQRCVALREALTRLAQLWDDHAGEMDLLSSATLSECADELRALLSQAQSNGQVQK